MIKTTPENTLIPEQTSKWIKTVVIDCNFCPFAGKAFSEKTIGYTVVQAADTKKILIALAQEFAHLDEDITTETAFIIFPAVFRDFNRYLDMVDKAEQLLEKENYEGVYQLASFHPDYCFVGAADDDPANYTNRSPYPMLQILREDSITKALANFPNPEKIPDSNIAFAKKKGLAYMQMLLASCKA
ncbi:MAG: DUF1415 domain-containing protein [Ferruginibacter sp.]